MRRQSPLPTFERRRAAARLSTERDRKGGRRIRASVGRGSFRAGLERGTAADEEVRDDAASQIEDVHAGPPWHGVMRLKKQRRAGYFPKGGADSVARDDRRISCAVAGWGMRISSNDASFAQGFRKNAGHLVIFSRLLRSREISARPFPVSVAGAAARWNRQCRSGSHALPVARLEPVLPPLSAAHFPFLPVLDTYIVRRDFMALRSVS